MRFRAARRASAATSASSLSPRTPSTARSSSSSRPAVPAAASACRAAARLPLPQAASTASAISCLAWFKRCQSGPQLRPRAGAGPSCTCPASSFAPGCACARSESRMTARQSRRVPATSAAPRPRMVCWACRDRPGRPWTGADDFALAVAPRKNCLRKKRICRIPGSCAIPDVRPPREAGRADVGRRVADAEHASLGGTFRRATRGGSRRSGRPAIRARAGRPGRRRTDYDSVRCPMSWRRAANARGQRQEAGAEAHSQTWRGG